MDIFTIIIICVVAFILLSLCGYCCKRSKSGTITGPPVTITTAHVTATPAFQTPYPTNTPYPMPQPMPQMPQPIQPAGLGFSGYSGAYQTSPYPQATGQLVTPYPTTVPPPPPSYNEAMQQPVVPPPLVSENYSKQSPYNPNY